MRRPRGKARYPREPATIPTPGQINVLLVLNETKEEMNYRKVGEAVGALLKRKPSAPASVWSMCMFLERLGMATMGPPKITTKGRAYVRKLRGLQ